MQFILSKAQHNKLLALQRAKGIRTPEAAIDFAITEASAPYMEEFNAKLAEADDKRREAFKRRKQGKRPLKTQRRPKLVSPAPEA